MKEGGKKRGGWSLRGETASQFHSSYESGKESVRERSEKLARATKEEQPIQFVCYFLFFSFFLSFFFSSFSPPSHLLPNSTYTQNSDVKTTNQIPEYVRFLRSSVRRCCCGCYPLMFPLRRGTELRAPGAYASHHAYSPFDASATRDSLRTAG